MIALEEIVTNQPSMGSILIKMSFGIAARCSAAKEMIKNDLPSSYTTDLPKLIAASYHIDPLEGTVL
jgi:hypothetical protein